MEFTTTLIAISSAVIVIVGLYSRFGGGPVKKPKKKYGVEAAPATADSSPTIRNIRDKDKLMDGFNVPNIYQAFESSRKNYGHKKCLGIRPVEKTIVEEKDVKGVKKKWEFLQLGSYNWITYEEAGKYIEDIAAGLVHIGLKSNQNLGLYSETRPEWTITSNACFRQNIIVLTVYANLGQEQMVHAFNEGEIEVIVTNGALLKGLIDLIPHVPSLRMIVYTDQSSPDVLSKLTSLNIKYFTFTELRELGKANPVDPELALSSDDLAVIMYTSGTTGMPKGVMLSHRNVMATMGAAFTSFEITSNEVYLSFLPLAHILAFIIEMAILAKGGTIGSGSTRTLASSMVRNCKGDLEELRPTIFAGVPAVHDRIKQGIEARILNSGVISKTLFQLAYDSKKHALEEGKDTPFWNYLVFNKFKTALGGRVRFLVSGGAPLSAQCCEFMSVCFGVPVLQGYGLTETCGGSFICELDSIDIKAKSSGAPLSCCEAKLVDVPDMGYLHTDNPPRGEIYLRGPSISIGYYKNPGKTSEEFTKDKWFKTGDIGLLFPNNTFAIIDRKKNLVKPPHGEYIAPERLESIYRNCPHIANIMVYASASYNEVIAFVCPNRRALEDWAIVQGIKEEWNKICEHPKVTKLILDELNTVWNTAKLKSIEKIVAVKIFPEEWTPENGWLTAAMKLRRNEVHKRHAEEIESIYAKLPK